MKWINGTPETDKARTFIKEQMREKRIRASHICKATGVDHGNFSKFMSGVRYAPSFEVVQLCLNYLASLDEVRHEKPN